MGTKKGIILTILLVTLIFLSSCTSGQKKYESTQQVYRGSEGLELYFENIPNKIFYYGAGDENNKFEIDVKVENKGASYSAAAIYLSGFDPTIFEFEEIPLRFRRSGDNKCDFSVGFNFGTDDSLADMFQGFIQCTFEVAGIDLGIHYRKYGNSQSFGTTVDMDYVNDKLRIRGSADALYDLTRGRLGNLDMKIDLQTMRGAISSYLQGRLLTLHALSLPIGAYNGYVVLLSGKSEEFPYDDFEIVTFHGDIVNWPQGLDHIDTTLVATACYSYATTATPLICIAPYGALEEDKTTYTCRPKDSYILSGGQGAPVAVTKIEQTNAKDRVIFRIHVKNIGDGEVFDLKEMDKCSPYYEGKVTEREKNVVYVPLVLLGGDLIPLKCNPSYELRLDPKTKEGIITCEYKKRYATGKTTYQTPLYIELWYGYRETTKKKVRFESLYIN